MLIGGSMCQRELPDFIFSQSGAGSSHHECDRLGSLDLVINRHHAGLEDGRVPFEHAFYIAGIDVLTPGDEHVVGAAGEEMEAVCIPAENIASAIKAVGRDHRL